MDSCDSNKRVAIIGAGPSGIVAAKECLADGLKPTVYEKEGDIGGLWNPKTGATWRGMQTNLSRFSCSFSDFPWPSSSPEFPTQQQFYEYFCDYITHFSLQGYFQFNTKIIKIKRGQNSWDVTSIQENNEKTEKFDFVIIATGVFSKRYFPNIPEKNSFKGTILHSLDYKDSREIKGNKIIVIGGSYSGVEISSDLAKIGKKVINIIKNPIWIMPRYIPDKSLKGEPKLPLDLCFFKGRRPTTEVQGGEDIWKAKNNFFNNISNQGEVCSDLKIEDFKQPSKIAITSEYLDQIKCGNIKVIKEEIVSYNEEGVVMKNGGHESADTIIIATGYLLDLPFFEQDILDTISFDPNDQIQPTLLYKCTFHPDLKNMAFIGIYKGPFIGLSELQARWITSVWSNKQDLPSEEVMLRGLETEKRIRENVPRPQFAHGDYVAMAGSLAQEINVNPNYEELKTSDPELYDKLLNYALIPAHYRLKGNGKNVELALKQIEEVVNVTKKYINEAKAKTEKTDQ